MAQPWKHTVKALSVLLIALAAGLCQTAGAQSIRVKEIASVQGVRSNQLTGYGLVVGLDGTGDQTTQMPYTTQSMANYLQQFGLTLPAGVNPQMKNVAAVLVTAQLPAFAQPGQAIDVTVWATPSRCAAVPSSPRRCAGPMARFTRWPRATCWWVARAPPPAAARCRSTT